MKPVPVENQKYAFWDRIFSFAQNKYVRLQNFIRNLKTSRKLKLCNRNIIRFPEESGNPGQYTAMT